MLCLQSAGLWHPTAARSVLTADHSILRKQDLAKAIQDWVQGQLGRLKTMEACVCTTGGEVGLCQKCDRVSE